MVTARALSHFAALLGLPAHQAEDALYSERAARAVLSRRHLFAAGAALATGLVLVGGPLPLYVFTDDAEWYVARSLADAYELRGSLYGLFGTTYNSSPLPHEDYPLEELPSCSRMGIWSDAAGRVTEKSEDGSSVITRTMDDWCRRNGRGFLCTTES